MLLFLMILNACSTNDLIQTTQTCELISIQLPQKTDQKYIVHDVIFFDCNVFDGIQDPICWDLFNTSPV
jgi:hypothetical protein